MAMQTFFPDFLRALPAPRAFTASPATAVSPRRSFPFNAGEPIHHSLITAHCLLLAYYYSLLTIHYSPFTNN